MLKLELLQPEYFCTYFICNLECLFTKFACQQTKKYAQYYYRITISTISKIKLHEI